MFHRGCEPVMLASRPRTPCLPGAFRRHERRVHQKPHLRERYMKVSGYLPAIAIALAIGCSISSPTPLHAQAPAALTGQVSSQQEGPMEGVLVSAKKAGGTITVTV